MSESTTPSPEIWNNILKDNVEKDDPLWKEYLDKAAVVDVRLVDEWNKTVDVLLVYVALFISVLTSFIAKTTKFQRNPADITNDLLVAIYIQQVAQSNNISIPPVSPRSYFNQSQVEYDAAVTQNSLLYISLTLSIIVSLIALAAKLWLVSYSRQVFSVGSPYDRAMRRQEAYNGVLVWKMDGVINILPLILFIALYLFGFCVFTSVSAVQVILGNAIGVLLGLGVMFVIFTSLGAAIISGCPFRSPFSDATRFLLEKLWIIGMLRGPKSCRRSLLALGFSTLLCLGMSVPLFVSQRYGSPGTWFPSFSIALSLPIALVAQHKAVHKAQKYKISGMAALLFLVFLFHSVSITMVIFVYHWQLNDSNQLRRIIGTAFICSLIFIFIFGFFFGCWMIGKMSKSMADTGEIDALAWLLITTPPQHPATFFKKAGQMTGVDSIGRHYRPRLLESLIPLLTPLITSYHPPEHHSSDTHSPQSDAVLNVQPQTNLSPVNNIVPIDEDPRSKDLEIYIACLARLSEFTDCKGTFWCLREDAMQHPKLEQPLIDKLVELAKPLRHSQVVKSAASKVLNNYKLDMEGNPLRSPTILESVATDPRSETTSMFNDNDLNRQERGHLESYRLEDLVMHVEPAYSSEEVEEVRREIGDEEIEEVRRDVGDEEIEEVRHEIGDKEIEGNPLESPIAILGNAATDLRGETTLMLNNNWLNDSNCQEQGHSELYRLVDRRRAVRATCEDLATQVKPAYSSEEEIEEVRDRRQEEGEIG